MSKDREVEEEQAILDQAYRRLEAMRSDAERMLGSVLDLGPGGTFQARTERDIVVRTSLARLAQLDLGDQALCFGRIDRVAGGPEIGGELAGGHDARGGLAGAPGNGGGAAGGAADGDRARGPEIESFHIGRLAISGDDHEPLVVDWRARVAEPFYRATGLDPQGLLRRRHLAVRGRRVLGVEDEYFALPGRLGVGAGDGADDALAGSVGTEAGCAGGGESGLLAEGLALGGPGALLASLDRARTGRMSDIVGTIQREQDEIIRAPLAGALMVQGGPGTGKTAVALHRAAYLLYTHRFPLERQGVLVVGPNPLFLRYIEQVLPSLGETGVTLSTVAGLVPEIRVTAVDQAEVARLKGDVRMVRVLAAAVRTRQRPLRRDLAVPFGAATLRLSADESAELVRRARRRPGTHNARRQFMEELVTQHLVDQYRRFRDGLLQPPPGRWDGEGPFRDGDGPLGDGDPGEDGGDGGVVDVAETGRQLRRIPLVSEALDRMWPRLSPHELLHDLFGARPLLAAAGEGILTTDDQALLYRPRSSSLGAVPWTAADAALVDEARTLLGPRRRRRQRRGTGRDRTGQPGEQRDDAPWPAGLDPSPMPRSFETASDDEPRQFGHIVVDEVQDLSPLQLRMLARRSLSGSMTVVGDLAQGTGPWAASSWSEIARHLCPGREPAVTELTVSYRTPAEVIEVARGVLEAGASGFAPPRPVRRSGSPPTVRIVPPSGLGPAVAEAVRGEVGAVGSGRVAALVPPSLFDVVVRALLTAGIDAVDPRRPGGSGLASPVVILPADECNGLEFDSVVLVEPEVVVDGAEPWGPFGEGVPGSGMTRGGDRAGSGGARARGLRTLYVVLTRTTRRLAVVSSRQLPDYLRIP